MSYRFDKDVRPELVNLSSKYGVLSRRCIHERPMNTSILMDAAAIISATIQTMPIHDFLHFTPSGSCTGRFVNDTIFKYLLLVSDRPADRAL